VAGSPDPSVRWPLIPAPAPEMHHFATWGAKNSRHFSPDASFCNDREGRLVYDQLIGIRRQVPNPRLVQPCTKGPLPAPR
jgi:hypothetical protein